MSFDEILQTVGDGKEPYQLMTIFWMSAVHYLASCWQISSVMEDVRQPYRCVLNDTVYSSYNSNGSSVYIDHHSCSASIVRNFTESGAHTNTEEISDCVRYNFSTDVLSVTVRSRYLLVCQNERLASLGTNVFYIGLMTANFGFGWLGDRKGRLFSLNVSLAFSLIGVIMAIFSPWFALFVVARLFLGISVGGIFLVGYTLAIECLNKEDRALPGIMMHNGMSIAGIITVLIGYLTRDFIKILMISSVIIFVSSLLNISVYESPRWLYATKKWKLCEKVMRDIAKKNKRSFPDGCMPLETEDNLNESGSQTDLLEHPIPPFQHETLLTALKFPEMRRILFLSWFLWFVIGLIFYGMFYATQDVGGGIFLNTVLICLVDIVFRTSLLLVVKKYGRKVLFGGSMAIAACGLAACGITKILSTTFSLPEDISIPFVIIARIGITINMDVAFLSTTEVFPTVIRNAAVGASVHGARIASVLTPQIPLLNEIWPSLALFVLAGLAGVACFLLARFWPETKDIPLPETLEETELLVLGKWPLQNIESFDIDHLKIGQYEKLE